MHATSRRTVGVRAGVLALALLLSGLASSQSPTASGETAAALEPPAPLELGPVEGLTSTWHVAPGHTGVPAGLTVRLRQPVPADAIVTWSGAEEVARTDTASVAECPLGRAGRTVAVSVSVAPPAEADLLDPLTASPEPFTHACVLEVLDVAVEDVVVGPLDADVAWPGRFDPTSNEDALALFFGPAVAGVVPTRDGWRTSVDRPISVSAAVEPAALAPLLEWRVNGAVTALGPSCELAATEVGTQRVDVGPPGGGARVVLEAYGVVITTRPNVDGAWPENVPLVFEAVTEPAGHEDEIVWLAATKYGGAAPPMGSGPRFSTVFSRTWGGDPATSWVGVKAGNAAEGGDGQPPAETSAITVQSMPTGVDVTVTPPDENGNGDGTTPFVREYEPGTQVCLTAPDAKDGKCFLRWEVDGEQRPFGKTKLTLDVAEDDVTTEAVYQCKITDCNELIAAMIAILEGCVGDDVRPKADKGTGDEVGIGPTGKQVVDCLTKISDAAHRNIEKECLDDHVNAHVDGDKTADCRDADEIKVNKDKWPSDQCDAEFAERLGTLFHEGTHSLQDWSCYCEDERPEDCVPKTELPAYLNGKRARDAIKAAIDQIKANRVACNPDTDGLDTCFEILTDCKTEELCAMLPLVNGGIARDAARITRYSETLGWTCPSVAESPPLAGGAAFGLAEGYYAASLDDVLREDFAIQVRTDLQSGTLTQTVVGPGLTIDLVTSMARVLDLRLARDTFGDEVLLAAGTTLDYETGGLASGVVASYRDTNGDGLFDGTSETLLVSGTTALQSGNALTEDPDTGELFVYDAILRRLTRLADTDADGVPDALAGSSILPADAPALARRAVATFSDDHVEARSVFGDLVGANVDHVRFEDTDDDGFYETLVEGPANLIDERAPTACTRPFFGNTSFGLFGSPGHVLRVDEVTAGGTFIQTLGTATVPAGGNETVVALAAPLAFGQFLRITDETSGMTSDVFPTEGPVPVVYEASAHAGPLGGGTPVTYTGENLPAMSQVLFGGTAATIVTQNDTSVSVLSPAGTAEEVVTVELVPVSGDTLTSLFEYEPPAPVTPTPDAGADQVVSLGGGGAATLDGSGSSPNGGPAINEWVWTGPFTGGIAFGTSPTVTFASTGTFDVVLQVGTPDSASPIDVVTITVVP